MIISPLSLKEESPDLVMDKSLGRMYWGDAVSACTHAPKDRTAQNSYEYI